MKTIDFNDFFRIKEIQITYNEDFIINSETIDEIIDYIYEIKNGIKY